EKGRDCGQDIVYNGHCVTRCWGTSDARWGCEDRGAVQLRELRGAGASGSSVAGDPEDRQRGAGDAVAGVRKTLCQVRTAIDSAGETAARLAAASLLFGAFGAPADGAARLQSVVPLVCRAVAGCRGVGRDG